MRRMEKVAGDNPPLTSSHSSPRSTLGWKDAWGNENAELEPTKYKSLVTGPAHTRSKSLAGSGAGCSPFATHSDGPKTRSLQWEASLLGPSPARCNSFAGRSSTGAPSVPKGPPLQAERQTFGSFSPPRNANRRSAGGMLQNPQWASVIEGPAPRAVEMPRAKSPPTPIVRAKTPPTPIVRAKPPPIPIVTAKPPPTSIVRAKSPPTPPGKANWILRGVHVAANERGFGAQLPVPGRPQDRLSEVCPPSGPPRIPAQVSQVSSAVSQSARENQNLVRTADSKAISSDDPASSSAVTAAQEVNSPEVTRMQVISSLNEELMSIRTCMNRAIDLGKKVQHYGAMEVTELRGVTANVEAEIHKTAQMNSELEQQVSSLRDEVQKLQWEKELEVLSMHNEIQELEMERTTLTKAAREEKKKREKLQTEVDAFLSVLLEEKMKLENEREAHQIALRNEKKKLQAMRKARDDAVKALEVGNQKLEVERDAMLLAMRDLRSRLELERDSNLRSMRRTSMDMATMMSGRRSSGGKMPSISISDNGPPISRPVSMENSIQFQ